MELINTSERTGHGVMAHFTKLQMVGEAFVAACAQEGGDLSIEKITQALYGGDEIILLDRTSGMRGRLFVFPYEVKGGENYSLAFRPNPPDVDSGVFLEWASNSKRGPLKRAVSHTAARALKSLRDEAELYEKRETARKYIVGRGAYFVNYGYNLGAFKIGPHTLQIQHHGDVRVQFVEVLTAEQAVAAIVAARN